MTGKIASRKAGLNLAKIVVLLLLPVVLFGFFYIREAERDIATVELELKGLELANLVSPIMFGKPLAADDRLKQRMAGLESAIFGKKPQLSFEAVLAAQNNIASSDDGQSREAEDYTFDVLTRSGLILDSEAQSYFLIIAALADLPDVIGNYRAVVFGLKHIAAARGVAKQASTSDVLMALGNTLEAHRRMKNSLKSAEANSGKPKEYAVMAKQCDRLTADISELVVVAKTFHDDGNISRVDDFLHSKDHAAQASDTGALLWTAITDKARQQLENRNASLRKTYGLLLAVGFACGLVALGYALIMFTENLRKLDEVEGAKAAETTARLEAETMAAKLGELNDGMAVLNKDLSANIARLNAAQDELLKKGRMEQLGQLTATIAHELRNPLGTVRTSAFLLERKLQGKGLGTEAQIERINKGVVRCDNIITQLLDFSRTRKLTATKGNLDQWLEGVVQETAKGLPASVQISCVLGLADGDVAFDAARLERAVINLLNNASEALMGRSERPTDSQRTSHQIEISTALAQDHVAIRVRDNGPGMSPEVLARIREPLFTTKNFGTGLGIPAIEQIAHQHNGRLEIESEAGHGSLFTILLPLDGQQQGEAA